MNLGDGNAFFAVFDGHGGREVARFAEKHFCSELVKNKSYIVGNYRQALEENFMRMDEFMASEQGFAELL